MSQQQRYADFKSAAFLISQMLGGYADFLYQTGLVDELQRQHVKMQTDAGVKLIQEQQWVEAFQVSLVSQQILNLFYQTLVIKKHFHHPYHLQHFEPILYVEAIETSLQHRCLKLSLQYAGKQKQFNLFSTITLFIRSQLYLIF